MFWPPSSCCVFTKMHLEIHNFRIIWRNFLLQCLFWHWHEGIIWIDECCLLWFFVHSDSKHTESREKKEWWTFSLSGRGTLVYFSCWDASIHVRFWIVSCPTGFGDAWVKLHHVWSCTLFEIEEVMRVQSFSLKHKKQTGGEGKIPINQWFYNTNQIASRKNIKYDVASQENK